MFNPPLVQLGLFELSLTPHLSLLEVPSVGKFSPSNCAAISFCFIIRFGAIHWVNYSCGQIGTWSSFWPNNGEFPRLPRRLIRRPHPVKNWALADRRPQRAPREVFRDKRWWTGQRDPPHGGLLLLLLPGQHQGVRDDLLPLLGLAQEDRANSPNSSSHYHRLMRRWRSQRCCRLSLCRTGDWLSDMMCSRSKA